MTTALPRDFSYAKGAALEVSAFGDAREQWESLSHENHAASLFHRPRWLDLLCRAYGYDLSVALLRSGPQLLAGCVMAHVRTPFAHRLVALPFSDRCEPLACNEQTIQTLLATLAVDPRIRTCEIRGAAASWPWTVVECFQNWELRVSSQASRLYQQLATNFRRNVVRARRSGVRIEHGCDQSILSRFCQIHFESRRHQGVPAQPASFFRLVHEIFAPSGDLDVWIASYRGSDLAAVLTLRDRDRVYYKWSARSKVEIPGAGHLLTWSIVETIATTARVLDLGRTDLRNHGLNRYKRELGAVAYPLPYSFFPRAPRQISPEVLSGWRSLAASAWRRMPRNVCQMVGGTIYRYLS